MALLVAGLAGEITRRVRLPRVTGYSLVGLLLGPSLFGWFGPEDVGGYRILVDLALSLLLFELGVRVDLHWFRANPWIIVGSLAESGFVFAGTFVLLRVLDASAELAAAVSAIAVGTSPAVVMRVTTDLKAEGQVTQRLFVLTALNVIYSVVLSKLVIGSLHGTVRGDWTAAVLHPLYLLFGSFLAGAVIASAFRLLRGAFGLVDEQATAVIFGLLLLSASLLQAFSLPAMLAPLLAGILVKRWDPRPHLWPRHFGTAGGVLVMLLFVLTGVAFSVRQIAVGGVAALALVVVRLLCKGFGVALFAPVSGLSLRQSLSLGFALLPMADIALLLVDDLSALYPEFGARVGEVVISMIAMLGLVGPIAVQWALRRAGESMEKEG